jgi:hypothetical protein
MAEKTLHLVEMAVCEECLRGEGDECRTPKCAFYKNTPPIEPLNTEFYKIKKTVTTEDDGHDR